MFIEVPKNCHKHVPMESGEKCLVEKSLVEKMAIQRKPGGKKAWSVLGKNGKKFGGLFLGLIHIKINDEVKLTCYFNHLISKCVL